MRSSESPLLSIVITSYTMDRFKDICDLLDSIKQQQFAQNGQDSALSEEMLETIFIAERSLELYEKVKEHAEDIGLANFRLLLSGERLGLGGARNLGAKEARGQIIAFVDDDAVLFPEWAREMVNTYEDKAVMGVTGASIPLWQDRELDWLPKSFYWLISCNDWTGWNEITEARTLWGQNMSLRKEALAKSGSFHPKLGYHQPVAEDLELSLRVKRRTGGRLLYNPNVRVWHKIYAFRVNLKYVAARAHHIGVSRRVIRNTDLREQTNLRLEKHAVDGILKVFLGLPADFLRSPHIAWKKFTVALTIVIFSGAGFVFPGKNMMTARYIQSTIAGPIGGDY